MNHLDMFRVIGYSGSLETQLPSPISISPNWSVWCSFSICWLSPWELILVSTKANVCKYPGGW